jgi:hypothetical protein
MGGLQSVLERGQSFTNRIFGEFGDAVDIELIHNLLAVRLNGLHAYL